MGISRISSFLFRLCKESPRNSCAVKYFGQGGDGRYQFARNV